MNFWELLGFKYFVWKNSLELLWKFQGFLQNLNDNLNRTWTESVEYHIISTKTIHNPNELLLSPAVSQELWKRSEESQRVSRNPQSHIISMKSLKKPVIPRDSPEASMKPCRILKNPKHAPPISNLKSKHTLKNKNDHLWESIVHSVRESARGRVGNRRVGTIPLDSRLWHSLKRDITTGLQERCPFTLILLIMNFH